MIRGIKYFRFFLTMLLVIISTVLFKEVFAGVNLYIEGVNNNFKYSFEINHKGTYKLIRWKYYDSIIIKEIMF